MGQAAIAPVNRRTQAERSAATRARLLDATVESLLDLGYARTTTPEIARRAGLSRGAQLHHFPTKAELVLAAVEHLFLRRQEEFRHTFAALPAGADPTAAAIDLLWTMVSGPTFCAWLELAVAARTDPELRERVAALSARFVAMVEETFDELFPAPAEPNPLFQVAPLFAFALLDGLALGRMLGGEHPHVPKIIEGLKMLAPLAIPALPPPK
jgi:AcrR family transcriptional regulator